MKRNSKKGNKPSILLNVVSSLTFDRFIIFVTIIVQLQFKFFKFKFGKTVKFFEFGMLLVIKSHNYLNFAVRCGVGTVTQIRKLLITANICQCWSKSFS